MWHRPMRWALATQLALAGGVAPCAQFSPEVTQAIDTCIAAALQQHDGQPIGWGLEGPGTSRMSITVVAKDNRVWAMECADGKITSDERKTGTKKYQMLSGRLLVSEQSARATAALEYPSADLTRMDYELGWSGRPQYKYRFALGDGRVATVEVNGETGRIDHTESKRE